MPAVIPNAVNNAAPLESPASILIMPLSDVLPSLLAVELAYSANFPDTLYAVTPVMPAPRMAPASPVTVFDPGAGTYTSVSLMLILAPAVKLLGVAVPVRVAQDVFQASRPILTQVLLEFL
jgi:hypothetical protein